MATYQQALLHVRGGGTARCGERIVRYLNQEEANAHELKRNPSTRSVGQPDGPIKVEHYGYAARPRMLGLFDVSQSPPAQFRPTPEDISGEWVREGIDDAPPEPVAPEVVDDALKEETPS